VETDLVALQSAVLVPPAPRQAGIRGTGDGTENCEKIKGTEESVPLVPPVPREPDSDLPCESGDDGVFWRRRYRALANGHARLGRPEAEARVLAFGALLNDWHTEHDSHPTPGRCGGCGRSIMPGAGILGLPDGAEVHADAEFVCLITYGTRWRTAAADGLRRLGIAPPDGWTVA